MKREARPSLAGDLLKHYESSQALKIVVSDELGQNVLTFPPSELRGNFSKPDRCE
jgi:hypothetical protein